MYKHNILQKCRRIIHEWRDVNPVTQTEKRYEPTDYTCMYLFHRQLFINCKEKYIINKSISMILG